MNWKLIIEDDVGETVEVPLRQDVTTIGRKDGNMIKLTERNVSRDHALLIKENGTLFVEDLESYTGVKINGERIHGKVKIQEGDLIEIGDYHLALQPDGIAKAVEKEFSGGPGMQSLQTEMPSVDSSVAKDDFAGETERWVPPDDIPPLDRALPTVQEGKPVPLEPQVNLQEEQADSAIPTVAEAMPISSGGTAPTEETAEALPIGGAVSNKAPASNAGGQAGRAQTGEDLLAQGEPLNEAFAQSNETQPFQKPEIDGLPIEHPESPTKPPAPSIGNPNVLSDLEETELDAAAGANVDPAPGPANPEAASLAQVDVREVVEPPPKPDEKPVSPLPQVSEPPQAVPAAAVKEEEGLGLGHRLYVVNSTLAGTVYNVDQPEMVLGRVEENDIVMEHRSISRNHAKLHVEDDIARIVDLKSANGIFLNGNEVDQAILRSGDIIELGRVQIRYLTPGEEYNLSPYEIKMAHDADVATESANTPTLSVAPAEINPGRQKQPILVILLGTIIVLLLCILFLVVRGSGAKVSTKEKPQETVSTELTSEEKEAEELEKQGKYREAEKLLVPLVDSEDPLLRKRVKDVLSRVQNKIPAQSQLKDLQNAMNEKQYKDAVNIGLAVQPGTDAFDRAKDLVAIARKKGLSELYEKGITALNENQIDPAVDALKEMQWFDAEYFRTRELETKIKEKREEEKTAKTVKAKKQPSKSKSARSNRSSKSSAGSKKKASPAKDTMSDSERKQIAQGLLKNAKGHMFRADWRAALKELEKAKQFDSSEAEIYSRLGAVYTALKRPAKAVSNYKRFLQLRPYDRSRDRIRAQIKELEKEL